MLLPEPLHIPLSPGKKVFFASDFHLGVPNLASSLARERNIVRWLSSVQDQAGAIFLVGDIFDFWFEYRHTIPKGFIRLQGKLAELADAGIPLIFFTGNHDMWMFDYFTQEMGIVIHRNPQPYTFNQTPFLIGHGDGLGPGDHVYKVIKRVFASPVCQWLFARLHPNLGIGIATMWSRKSRISNSHKDDEFLGDDEWLLTYCREVEKVRHFDYYIFGHRHLPLDLPVGDRSRYVNLGEWVSHCTFASFDGEKVVLEKFEGGSQP